jgi:hypothetical protein
MLGFAKICQMERPMRAINPNSTKPVLETTPVRRQLARWAACLSIATAAGCSTGNAGTSAIDGFDSGNLDLGSRRDQGMPPEAFRFADLYRWSVPGNGLSFGVFTTSVADGRYWDTFDINGDGKPDLVITADTTKGSQVWDAAGAPYWKVHLNTGTTFAAATKWSVPQTGLSDGVYARSQATSYRYWTTIDLNGDRKPDLVLTADTTKSQQVWDATGSPYWKVFLNTGSGFGPAMNWPVPRSGLDDGFFASNATQAYRYWSLLDVNGDGKPDLLHTGDTTKGQQVWDAAGSPYWKVYLNTGSGFGPAMNWMVPQNGTYEGIYATDLSGYRNWTLVDLDSDGKVDLIQTSDPTKGQQVWDSSGNPYWKVSRNTGTGFGAVANWMVPQSGQSSGFYSTSASVQYQYWQLIDITGDGKLDLVQTGDSTKPQQVWDATGTPYWKVFRNNGSGFSQATNWLVPGSGISDGFFTPKYCSGSRCWSTLDLNGDQKPDLVQTVDSNASTQVWDVNGTPYWKVFLGSN